MCVNCQNFCSFFFFQGDDSLTKKLLDRIHARKRIYVILSTYHDKYVIRFVVCSRLCQEDDIAFAWKEISSQATEIFREEHYKTSVENIAKVTDDNVKVLNLTNEHNIAPAFLSSEYLHETFVEELSSRHI